MAKIKPKTLLAQSKQKKGPAQIGPRIITYLVVAVLVVSSVYALYKYWQQNKSAATAAVEN